MMSLAHNSRDNISNKTMTKISTRNIMIQHSRKIKCGLRKSDVGYPELID